MYSQYVFLIEVKYLDKISRNVDQHFTYFFIILRLIDRSNNHKVGNFITNKIQ